MTHANDAVILNRFRKAIRTFDLKRPGQHLPFLTHFYTTRRVDQERPGRETCHLLRTT